MPTYQFMAIDKTGQAVRGEEAAKNLPEAAERLRERGLTVLDLRETMDLKGRLSASLGFGRRLPLYPTVVVVRQLATMTRAGIPLGRTLDTITNQGLNDRLDAALQQIQKEVRTGFSLTQAFENQAGRFPSLTAPMIKAGESSGNLDEMLDRLAHYLEKDLALRRAWTQASVYPFLIFFACCVLTVGMVSYVFPTFIDLFRGLDVTLPVFTRALITVTETVRNPIVFMPVLAGTLLSATLLWQYFLTPVGRRQWDWLRLEIPYLGTLARKIALSRVARTLGTLLASGIPTLAALKIAGAGSDNSIIRDGIDRIATEMKRGVKLSEALCDVPLFPRVFVQMVQAGEESGELNDMLLRLGGFFEEEVQLALAAFTAMIEPVMIALMGGLVLFVLVAVFQPIYQLMAMF
jgi:type IV pilus assembly protein PilC